MAVRDDRSDVKQTTTGFRGPLMVQSLTSAKSKFLSLITVLTLACALSVYAQEAPTLTQAHFGINLGMGLKELSGKCRQAGVSADTQRWSFQDKDHPGRIIGLNGALNGNKAIKETKVSAYNDRVYEIELVFKDASLQNFNIHKAALKKEYGRGKSGVFDSMENKVTHKFYDHAVDQSVSITLNHDISFNEQGGTLSLSYEYDAIQKLVVEEMNRRKASLFLMGRNETP